MDAFEDDFAPLQSCPPVQPEQQKQAEDSGDDVPALRLSPTPGGDEPVSTASSDLSGNGGGGATPAEKKLTSIQGSSAKPQREEPAVIREWKQQQVAALEKKDQEEEEAKLNLRQQAKKELDDWYRQHAEQLVKLQQANRSASESAEMEIQSSTQEISPGTEWERVAKLCDFNPKTARNVKDVGRMRSVILQLKQQSNNHHHHAHQMS